jgi:NADH:ubiquinone oxidoreductase subunit K
MINSFLLALTITAGFAAIGFGILLIKHEREHKKEIHEKRKEKKTNLSV